MSRGRGRARDADPWRPWVWVRGWSLTPPVKVHAIRHPVGRLRTYCGLPVDARTSGVLLDERILNPAYATRCRQCVRILRAKR